MKGLFQCEANLKSREPSFELVKSESISELKTKAQLQILKLCLTPLITLI